mgnify:FL=1
METIGVKPPTAPCFFRFSTLLLTIEWESARNIQLLLVFAFSFLMKAL